MIDATPMPGQSLEVTQILHAIDAGDSRAAGNLLPLVYDELRKLAAQKLSRENPGQTLQATALVHEAYLRLLGPDADRADVRWDSRAHLFAAAAETMRRILIDNARRKKAVRHGGDQHRVDLNDAIAAVEPPTGDLAADVLELNDALDKLAAEDPAKAQLVKLRYFGGLTLEEAAAVINVSRATADRYWSYAKAWLFRELKGANS
jgi:RNA polymerase sigma factor (TIGR02999 family)